MKTEWSKSYMTKPRDNLVSHVFIKSKRFVPSYERDPCPPPMSWIIGMEYARIWRRECQEHLKIREMKMKPKRIRNDYKTFLKKRAPKKQKVCAP